jgi:hypothetical protein
MPALYETGAWLPSVTRYGSIIEHVSFGYKQISKNYLEEYSGSLKVAARRRSGAKGVLRRHQISRQQAAGSNDG